MQRREFITLLGGAAVAWPFVARAQQSTMPVVGFVNVASAERYAPQVSAFLKGLSEAGYVVGRNVAIEYRWAEGRIDRLPAMVADLVHRQVAVIAATTTPAALAAKAATTTIPIVFETGGDPVQFGLVPSLNRPGGNVTGVTQTNWEITPKRLQLLHELVPAASVIALLVNPANPTVTETTTKAMQAAAPSFGLELHILNASTERDFDGVFAKLTQLRAGGLVIGQDPFFASQREQLAALTVRHAVPAIGGYGREFAAAGGLLSYGADIADAYRLTGIYVGRVLKGEKPADLPVQQATKVELYINLKTAKALGVNVPNTLIGRVAILFAALHESPLADVPFASGHERARPSAWATDGQPPVPEYLAVLASVKARRRSPSRAPPSRIRELQ
jgi:putative tryptophan/tyrosine transport system substrate-binding protein